MRDAIIYSGWSWEAFNAPERLALALETLGAKVLYCQLPASGLRGKKGSLREIRRNIYAFRPVWVGSRLNHLPPVRHLQAALVRRQLDQRVIEMGLRRPFFFYFWLGDLFPLCSQMKGNYSLIHVRMDHAKDDADPYIEISDATLVIPRSVFHKLKARFGKKISLIPQSVDLRSLNYSSGHGFDASPALRQVPKPRLGYLGPARVRLNIPLLASVLQAHPEWHFVSVGASKAVPLVNAHAMPWVGPDETWAYAAGFDVGFMPYNCSEDFQLHCVPLKLFEYFALGMPVVSTPLINLWEYEDLIYFGDTAEELASAIRAALNESPDSPKRQKRMAVARSHSIESLAQVLCQVLPLDTQDGACSEDAAMLRPTATLI